MYNYIIEGQNNDLKLRICMSSKLNKNKPIYFTAKRRLKCSFLGSTNYQNFYGC